MAISIFPICCIKYKYSLSSFRGRSQMTSIKFSGFLTPAPLVSTKFTPLPFLCPHPSFVNDSFVRFSLAKFSRNIAGYESNLPTVVMRLRAKRNAEANPQSSPSSSSVAGCCCVSGPRSTDPCCCWPPSPLSKRYRGDFTALLTVSSSDWNLRRND